MVVIDSGTQQVAIVEGGSLMLNEASSGVVVIRQGAPGPTAVSSDPHNQATIGSDGLLHVQIDMIVVQELADVPQDTPTGTVVVVPQ